MPQEPTSNSSAPVPTPWWPFISIASLLIVIVALAIVFYMAYAHNVELAAENTALRTQASQLSADKDTMTAQIADLTKQVAKMKCTDVWNGDACVAATVSISAEPGWGPSPLSVALKTRAKDASYSVTFGDGATQKLSTATGSAGACTPEADGLCTFTLTHIYKLTGGKDSVYTASVKQGTTTVASTSVSVTAK